MHIHTCRFKAFCQQALLSEKEDIVGCSADGCYCIGKATAFVVNKAAETLNFVFLKQLMTANTVSPFTGVSLSVFDTRDLHGEQVKFHLCQLKILGVGLGIFKRLIN